MDPVFTHCVPMDSTSADSVPDSLRGSVPPYEFGAFRTVHPPLVQQLKQLEIMAQSTSNVLILGESGTGKELLAHAVHHKSSRRGHPFIPINCTNLPAELLESELFGHTRGAFTGALSDKRGLLEACHQGTLFLDEIGDLPLSLQPKLLRVLEDKRFLPVGSTQFIAVDFRLVCATNQNLEAMTRQGHFREDLYYRLGWGFEIPPLRFRPEDIQMLAEHFLRQWCEYEPSQERALKLSATVWGCLLAHEWPGNGRELKQAIHSSAAFCTGDVIEWEHLPEACRGDGKPSASWLDWVRAAFQARLEWLEQQVALEALDLHGGNHQQAAQALGISPRTLYRWLRGHALTWQIAHSPTHLWDRIRSLLRDAHALSPDERRFLGDEDVSTGLDV